MSFRNLLIRSESSRLRNLDDILSSLKWLEAAHLLKWSCLGAFAQKAFCSYAKTHVFHKHTNYWTLMFSTLLQVYPEQKNAFWDVKWCHKVKWCHFSQCNRCGIKNYRHPRAKVLSVTALSPTLKIPLKENLKLRQIKPYKFKDMLQNCRDMSKHSHIG